MKRTLMRLVVVALVAAFAVPPAGALARGDLFRKDAGHFRTWSTDDERAVKLKHKGGDVPYAKYLRTGTPNQERTLENKSGVGSIVRSNRGAHVFALKGCYTIGGWPDECTGWDYDRN